MSPFDKIDALVSVHSKMESVDYHSFKYLKHMADNQILPIKAYDRIDEYYGKYVEPASMLRRGSLDSLI